ncbi:Regulator of RpoS [Candidatus Gugararchaeum adminiculabundum]|nr:Regulator of RpoS [Candidatus Gugararchaeum adminiculabundum]
MGGIMFRRPVENKALSHALSQKRILIVDDDHTIVKLFETFLTRSGYANVITATSVEEAKREVREGSSFDLVVTDWVMPEIREIGGEKKTQSEEMGMTNGWEFVMWLREQNPAQKILMVSGYLDKIDKAAEQRGVATLPKGDINIRKFLDAVEKTLIAAELSRAGVAPIAAQVPSQMQKRVLLVDDEAYVLEIFKKLIERMKFEDKTPKFTVETAVSGEDAVAKMDAVKGEGKRYDIVVTDKSMPGKDGHAVIEHARKLFGDIGAVMISGSLIAADLAVLGKERIIGLSKPANMEEIHAAMAKAEKQVGPRIAPMEEERVVQVKQKSIVLIYNNKSNMENEIGKAVEDALGERQCTVLAYSEGMELDPQKIDGIVIATTKDSIPGIVNKLRATIGGRTREHVPIVIFHTELGDQYAAREFMDREVGAINIETIAHVTVKEAEHKAIAAGMEGNLPVGIAEMALDRLQGMKSNF